MVHILIEGLGFSEVGLYLSQHIGKKRADSTGGGTTAVLTQAISDSLNLHMRHA